MLRFQTLSIPYRRGPLVFTDLAAWTEVDPEAIGPAACAELLADPNLVIQGAAPEVEGEERRWMAVSAEERAAMLDACLEAAKPRKKPK